MRANLVIELCPELREQDQLLAKAVKFKAVTLTFLVFLQQVLVIESGSAQRLVAVCSEMPKGSGQ